MNELILKRPNGLLDWLRILRLYRSAFPASERKPFSLIMKMYRLGKTDLWCIHRGKESLGFAATINSDKLILLDYFAISPRHRSQGIGSAALDLLLECYRGKGLFVEIEGTWLDVPDLSRRLRRKRFYLSRGLEELGVRAKLFGVDMELLGKGCRLDYDSYQAFYRDNYNAWAAEHVQPISQTRDGR